LNYISERNKIIQGEKKYKKRGKVKRRNKREEER
jgi:hypothetical protein